MPSPISESASLTTNWVTLCIIVVTSLAAVALEWLLVVCVISKALGQS
jgi:hypothetical protein